MRVADKNKTLILASASRIRKALLDQAKIEFNVIPSTIDEGSYKNDKKTNGPQALSKGLAIKKALDVSTKHQGLVIGADQILEFEGKPHDKATSLEEAKVRLKKLSDKTHFLVGTTVLAEGNKIIWEHQSRIAMKMRNLSEGSIDTYLQKAGAGILSSVGCYEIEGLGITLFEEIRGDFFTVLGLPLLPLLGELRRQKAIST